jgi:hypothetical protein
MPQQQDQQLHKQTEIDDTVIESRWAIRQIAHDGFGLQRLAEEMGVSEGELLCRKREVAEAVQAPLNGANGNHRESQPSALGLGRRIRDGFRLRRNRS